MFAAEGRLPIILGQARLTHIHVQLASNTMFQHTNLGGRMFGCMQSGMLKAIMPMSTHLSAQQRCRPGQP